MKTIGRILIILLAAAIVIGGAYALLQTSAAQALVSQPMGQGGFEDQAGPLDFANGQDARQGGEHGGGSWITVINNLIEIAAVVVSVQVVWTIGRRIKRSGKKRNRLQLSHDS